MNITHTVRWDIAHRGNLYAGNYRNRKRENASGYIGANPSCISPNPYQGLRNSTHEVFFTMKQPWELNPALTIERLKQLASLIRNVRDDVIDLHNEELGDSARSTGLRAYECCRTRIIRAATQHEEWPWLGIVKDDGKFTFSIDSVPVRLYRGGLIVRKSAD
ncbi:hypothetical protein SB6408_01918 [Klebsiella spallanzanii]|uniref:Uncharacterized protein n=2 Tax=Klebsiella spallanzanii TaxID=2587528 RepID=A0A564N376_9ENTR|nr:hypothetical protein SB6408_01918 [Klebsiella spallanzanii]